MSFLIADAHAATPGPAGGGIIEMVIMMAIFFAIMYFMIIRPQQKRAKEHKALIDGLSKGDEIVAGGGLMGKITAVTDNYVEMNVADNVNIKVQKHSIASVLPKGSLKGE
ncbi:preprotein translocase subunit YajC [Thiofilum flexile]|uniref:preprotein translocase subunit YajC n=1 Tax=Thiofilum flexile TaxID=125627 RepID=UPI00037A37DC|nr:preprotein translocase subunit YajC [Thiofilum flexile]